MSRSGGDRNCVKLYGSIRYDNARTQNTNVLRHVFPNRSKDQLLGRQLSICVYKTQQIKDTLKGDCDFAATYGVNNIPDFG